MELNSFQLHVLQQIALTRNHLSPSIRAGFEDLLSREAYLLELGATICILPRQSGKTTLCKHLEETQGALVLTCSRQSKNYLDDIRGSNRSFLVVDEFLMLTKQELFDLLKFYPWSKVLLIGSYI